MRRSAPALLTIAAAICFLIAPLSATAKAPLRPAEPSNPDATFVVNNAGDTADTNPGNGVCATAGGVCTLRAAIQEANAFPGNDTIAFAIGTGAATIAPTSALPVVTAPVTIDGTTQPGYRGLPIVELNGTAAGAGADGLSFHSGSLVRGLVINRFGGNGINVASGNISTIQGNYIGTDVTGTLDRGNTGAGIRMGGSSSTIGGPIDGGPITGPGNLISGNNGGGIVIPAGANNETIRGNLIGANLTASARVGNTGAGVSIAGGSHTIGGTAGGNVIGGNSGDGIDITAGSAVVDGNFVGTDATGTVNLGNSGNGIAIATNSNKIGTNERNTVYFNTGAGIRVTAGTSNPLGHNLTFFNGGLGVDLGSLGITGNDVGDGDTGANNLQNFPVLGSPTLSASGTTVTFNVSMNSTAFAHFEIDYYTSPLCDPSGHGEGAHLAGTTADVQANSGGNLFFSKTVFADPGEVVTATATRLFGSTPSDTSEFSQCMDVPFAHAFPVNSTGDTGDPNPGNGVCGTGGVCTLRAAIQEANASPGRDLIDCFVGSGAQTIRPGSALPAITDPVTLDCTTQPGFVRTPLVEVNGSLAGVGVDGLTISGKHVTVRGLAVNRFTGDGIKITSAGSDAILQNNSIGTDLAGGTDLGNGGNGVTIGGFRALVGGAENTTFGNVISGNHGDGIVVSALLADVQRNMIGTSRGGTLDLGNDGDGVRITAPLLAAVGGRSAPFRNVISGNGANGVEILGSGASSTFANSVIGNFVGLGANGSTLLPNTLAGAKIGPDATNSHVGSTLTGTGNVISGNGDGGVVVVGASTGTRVLGNLVGTDSGGLQDRGNTGPGVSISGSPGVLVGGAPVPQRNVISGNGDHGVFVSGLGASGATILGNTIGLTAAGNGALGNDADGVFVSAPGAVVGGPGLGAGNIVSSNNLSGVVLSTSQASGATIAGNVVGLNANGAAAGNGLDGIVVSQAPSATIGGTNPGDGNVVSGNGSDGIQVAGDTATGAKVEGNRVGTNLLGLTAIGNGQAGIRVLASGAVVGGSEAGSSNQISGNAGNGVLISGSAATGAAVSGNLIGLRPGVGTGKALGNGGNGVLIINAHGNTVGAAQAHNQIGANSLDGVSISGAGATGNTVAGNEIGTDGAADLGNAHTGIRVDAPGNTIGTAGSANVVSGNDQAGLQISADNTGVQNNVVGLNAAGTAAVPNGGDGIRVLDAANTVIGDSAGASRNVIGGNPLNGIEVTGAGSTGTQILNNDIGRSGTLGAANGVGIKIANNASNALIGGVSTQGPATNVIQSNSLQGVAVSGGSTGNRIQANSIDQNGGLGIDLGPAGITPNDTQDPDTGPNNLQNFPTLTSAVTGGGFVSIVGSLNSTPLTAFAIDVYASPVCDASGNGEGATFVGSFTPAATSNDGKRAFSRDLPADVPAGEAITLTATDPNGNTSEFSPCVVAPEALADLSADLSDSPDPVTHGNNLTYTVTVANGGPDRSLQTTLTQTLGTNLTFVSATSTAGSCHRVATRVVCDLGKLAPAQTVTITIVATVSSSFTGTLSNTATAASPVSDPNPANNASTETTTVN